MMFQCYRHFNLKYSFLRCPCYFTLSDDTTFSTTLSSFCPQAYIYELHPEARSVSLLSLILQEYLFNFLSKHIQITKATPTTPTHQTQSQKILVEGLYFFKNLCSTSKMGTFSFEFGRRRLLLFEVYEQQWLGQVWNAGLGYKGGVEVVLVYNVIMSIELLLSSQFLKHSERVIQIIQIIAATPKYIHIVEEHSTDHSVQMAYNKLRLVSQTHKSTQTILTFKIWYQTDIITDLLLQNSAVNIVLLQGKQNCGNLLHSSHVIQIRNIKQLSQILRMSIFDLERRCKMEKMMRISSAKCVENESKQKIKVLALKYAEQRSSKSLQIFVSFMRFNTKWYKARIRKCFNVWLIETYEKNIDKMNENIVKQQYFSQLTHRSLTSKCFLGWKKRVLQQTGRKYII